MTDVVYFAGEAKWAKVREPDPKYKNYSIDLKLEGESLDLFDKFGLQLKVRKDENGDPWVTFRRPVEKLVKGELVQYSPPAVFLGDEIYPAPGLIGNGSKVVVKVIVYDTKKGRGHRLEAVKVTDLVAYGNTAAPDDVTPF